MAAGCCWPFLRSRTCLHHLHFVLHPFLTGPVRVNGCGCVHQVRASKESKYKIQIILPINQKTKGAGPEATNQVSNQAQYSYSS